MAQAVYKIEARFDESQMEEIRSAMKTVVPALRIWLAVSIFINIVLFAMILAIGGN